MKKQRRTAFTMVEMIFVTILAVMVALLVWQFLIQGARSSGKLHAKVDMMQAARMAGVQICRELQQSVEVLSPPVGGAKTTPVLVYLNWCNELIVIYSDKDNKLIRLNKSKNDQQKVLAEDVESFRAFRRGRRLVNIHLHFENKARKEDFDLISGATLRNSFN